MNKLLLHKIFRDLFTEKSRTSIVILALFIGVFSVSMMSTAYTILKRELAYNFQSTNPASATLFITGIDDSITKKIVDSGYAKSAETREKVVCRIQTPDNRWIPLWLYVTEDFSNIKINKFKIERGLAPAAENEILIEKSVEQLFGSELDKSYQIKFPGNGEKTFLVTGKAHDPGLAPAWMEGIAYGYVTKKGYEHLGIKRSVSELKIVFNSKIDVDAKKVDMISKLIALHNGNLPKKDTFDKESLSRSGLEPFLIRNGIAIVRSEIHDTKRHPHEGQLDSLLFMIFGFGILTLFLSAVLVINLISAIMAKQIRQIGILKAIGADTTSIALTYFTMVFIMGTIAAIAGIPLGIKGGIAYSYLTAKMLNFTIFSEDIPHYVRLYQVQISLLLPIAVTAFPIITKSKTAVNELLNDYGVETKLAQKESITDKIVSRIFPDPVFLMALKNTFRKKCRLILTLLTLSLGGSIFIASFNIKESTGYMIEKAFNMMNADILVSLDNSYPVDSIMSALKNERKTSYFEPFRTVSGTVDLGNEQQSPQVSLAAYTDNTSIISFEMESGSWLHKNDSDMVVINTAFRGNGSYHKNKGYKTGSKIELQCGKNKKMFTISGIVRQPFTLPAIYMTSEQLNLMTENDKAENIGIRSNASSFDESKKIAANIENALTANGLIVKDVTLKSIYKENVVEHLKIVTIMLILITILIIIVGGLSQISSMNINILERKRETGVLRALGMTDFNLYKTILGESLLLGFISWLISIVMAIPVSLFLGNNFCKIFLETNLDFKLSHQGIFLWLALLVIFSLVATVFPARKASKENLRDALEFE
jgi:putative ABC transport system permease protein